MSATTEFNNIFKNILNTLGHKGSHEDKGAMITAVIKNLQSQHYLK